MVTQKPHKHVEKQALPPRLFKNNSFLCFLGTQALGAFNDNVFKQLVLLLGAGYLLAGIEYQAVVQFLFALPFLLFSGLAGDLSDRFGKGRLIVLYKIAEVIITLLGVGAFLMITVGSADAKDTPLYLCLLAGVVFLLGTQSAFFGPSKYGGLPELVRTNDLASATGLTQMTTFLAIIFGVAVAGLLADLLLGRMYLAGLVTVGIALLGTLTSLGIARNPAADKQRSITAKSFISILPTLSDIYRHDPLMMRIMLVYSWFWFVGGVTLVAINTLCRFQLGLSNFATSMMVAMTSLGIAIGSVLVGRLAPGKVNISLVTYALIVLALCLLSLSLLPVYSPTAEDILAFNQLKNSPQLLALTTIFPVAPIPVRVVAFCLFLLLGVAAGFFSIPLLTFIQIRPPNSKKGQVFAAVNCLNWIFILASAIVYGAGMKLFANHANLLLVALGATTLLVGCIFMPGIFQLLKHDGACFIGPKQKK